MKHMSNIPRSRRIPRIAPTIPPVTAPRFELPLDEASAGSASAAVGVAVTDRVDDVVERGGRVELTVEVGSVEVGVRVGVTIVNDV